MIPLNSLRYALAGCLFLLFFPMALSAHPHLYVDCALELVSSPEGLDSIEEEWTFVGGFGSRLVKEFDSDGDRSLSLAEEDRLYRDYFQALAPYYYFTELWLDGEEYAVTRVEGFHAFIQGDEIHYRFRVSLGLRAGRESSSLKVLVFDETHYVNFALRDVCDPDSREGLSFKVDIPLDTSLYAVTNPFGVPYTLLSLSRSDAPDAGATFAFSSIAPLSTLSSRPPMSNDNPFLYNQDLFRLPPAINPFLGDVASDGH
jgi:ABC-type uncharacterized transport system substrate-binding protein